MLYQIFKPIARVALTWYYRSISVAGGSRIPQSGPVFFAVNHPNAMVDALVVACAVPRRVRFTAKATIFANPLAAAFLRNVGVIPLKRAADETKRAGLTQGGSGSGTSIGSSAGEAQHTPASAPPSVHENATAPAPTDATRNADSFRAVSVALSDGSAVVIFPEGKSHDEPALAPLRTGLARMALQAHDTLGVQHIQIIPVGLLFERKEEPRSRILVQIGAPIDVDQFLSSVADSQHAVELLTETVKERLAAITMNFETRDDAARISVVSETLAALLEPTMSVSNEGPSLSSVLALVRRTDRVRESLERDGPASELAKHVAQYEPRIALFRDRLKQEAISVSDIGIDLDTTQGARFAVREALRAALLLPISWWGRITHFIPIRVARALALRGATHRDEPAMNTLLFGLVLVLAAYTVETAIVWRLFGGWWALLFFATLIPSASSDLRYGDVARRRSERMRTYFKFRRNPALQQEILTEADWLRREAGIIEALS